MVSIAWYTNKPPGTGRRKSFFNNDLHYLLRIVLNNFFLFFLCCVGIKNLFIFFCCLCRMVADKVVFLHKEILKYGN